MSEGGQGGGRRWRRIERWLGLPAPPSGPPWWWAVVVLAGLSLAVVGLARVLFGEGGPGAVYGVALGIVGLCVALFGAVDRLERGRSRRGDPVLRAMRAGAFVVVLAASLVAAFALTAGG